jgi:hypothetical protein
MLVLELYRKFESEHHLNLRAFNITNGWDHVEHQFGFPYFCPVSATTSFTTTTTTTALSK